MKIKIDNPFRDDTHMSMMRVCQFMCVFTACIVAIMGAAGFLYAIVHEKGLLVLAGILAGIAAIITALLVPAFGGKAIQAFSEGTNAK